MTENYHEDVPYRSGISRFLNWFNRLSDSKRAGFVAIVSFILCTVIMYITVPMLAGWAGFVILNYVYAFSIAGVAIIVSIITGCIAVF